jgi:hypothetical protein
MEMMKWMKSEVEDKDVKARHTLSDIYFFKAFSHCFNGLIQCIVQFGANSYLCLISVYVV